MSVTAQPDDAFNAWGRVARPHHVRVAPRFRDELPEAIAEALREGRTALPVGFGRSYGRSCLNDGGALIDMSRLDHVLAFDKTTGVIRVEAGASLAAILELIVPHGWFLPTTPGTSQVSVGGAIANDVHGKNHHAAGSFGCAVRRMELLRTDGTRLELSLDENPELFAATIGGLGLTGVIAWAEFQLAPIKSAFLEQEAIEFANVNRFFDLAEESAVEWEVTAAWVDCLATGGELGRGVFFRANWLDDGDLDPKSLDQKISVPIGAPGWALNPMTLKAFNGVYRWLAARSEGPERTHYRPVFYPLDAVGGWNKLYGGRGFYQHQSVVPPEHARAAVAEMLAIIAKAKEGSFLAVLKTFGDKASPGLLSFPMEGATLALDFPNRGQRTLDLLARLDAVVAEAGGRLYPAKDGRMSAEMFKTGYPAWETFAAHIDPGLCSDFWRSVTA
ncbi:MAG: FAD-binding oxidoreductase [Maricaulaceae bacterium]|jgi:L-gulonolactone oxidase